MIFQVFERDITSLLLRPMCTLTCTLALYGSLKEEAKMYAVDLLYIGQCNQPGMSSDILIEFILREIAPKQFKISVELVKN